MGNDKQVYSVLTDKCVAQCCFIFNRGCQGDVKAPTHKMAVSALLLIFPGNV